MGLLGDVNCAGQPTRVGVTGHTTLPATTEVLVSDELRELLHSERELVGVTCLARGADRVFAEVVLDLGGRLEVILPSADYRDVQVRPEERPLFDQLVAAAASVRVLPEAHAGRAAYVAAGRVLVSSVDRLVAVWDGIDDPRPGSTADVVRMAHARRLPVTVLWPDGARRGSTADGDGHRAG